MTSRLGLDGGLQSTGVVAGKSDAYQHAAAKFAATPPTVVLGFGNILLGDDGAGVQLVERLLSELGPDAAAFIDAGTLSFSLLPYIEATTSMLVIDAAEINAVPGTIALFEGVRMDQFLSSARRRSVHEVGLIDLLDMARLRDCLPPRRALLCLQPGRIDWSERLSAPVAKALPEAARQAAALLQQWKNN
ncbi:MAG: HyaD/HybD family hydrogenase maturation endopeptidase [Steroidobacteraceae bacterium]